MTILYAPFAARAPSLKGQPSPKDYPHPKELAILLHRNGHSVVQVGGGQDEQVTPDFRKDLPFKEVGELINNFSTAICVDSYLQHHCWYLGKKAIVLWGMSDPEIFGHKEHTNLLQDRKYLRSNQFDLYYTNQYCSEAFVPPERVLEEL